MNMNVSLNIEITPKHVHDLMVTSFEGISGDWLNQVNPISEVPETGEGLVWWGREAFWNTDWSIELVTHEDGTKLLKREDFLSAMQEAVKRPADLRDVMTWVYDGDDWDALVANNLLQVAVFGEVVFG